MSQSHFLGYIRSTYTNIKQKLFYINNVINNIMQTFCLLSPSMHLLKLVFLSIYIYSKIIWFFSESGTFPL